MSNKTKQDVLRFPVRKTRSSKLYSDKKLNYEETTLLNDRTSMVNGIEIKRSSRKKKNDQENLSSPKKKNCFNGISPNKNDLVIINDSIPVIKLERTPLKNVPVVSNSCQRYTEERTPLKIVPTVSNSCQKYTEERTPPENVSVLSNSCSKCSDERTPSKSVSFLSNCQKSADKFKKILTPNKENEIIVKRCPIPFNLGSPRRSPRKLNFENSPFNLGSPRRSPRKLNFENSPSHLISKLSFSSPKAAGSTIGLHKVELKAYQALKASLTQSCKTEIVGRKTEMNFIKEFLDKHLRNSLPGSLYISGAPGTGKTALVTKIITDSYDIPFKQIILNCMSKTSSKEIFSAIAEGLKLNVNRTEREIIKQIEKSLTSSKIPVVIILDEVDQLESKDQKVLYTLFEWPALANSKLILIGIANMLDLTDRILPRLQSVESCKPQLMHFAPYSKLEIIEIINERIKEANIGDGVQVIKPSAIQFLAGKVSSVAGDVRKALDVCRRAVELCEMQVKKQLRLVVNKSPSKSPRKLTNSVLKQVDVPQVLAIFNEIYGSKVTNEITDNPNSFPLQQKVLICSLLLILKHSKTKTVNLGQFHEVYSRVCIRQKLPSIEQSEFYSLCSLLEARGMLQVKKSKELRNSKIILRLNEDETVNALGDKVLLANVLEDKQSLNRTTIKKD